MLNICLITPNLRPVPDVKGGAIEGIVTNILKQQEVHKKINLTVVSIYDLDAYKESKKYKNTDFIFIKKDLNYVLNSIRFKFLNKYFNKKYSTYNYQILKKIKKINFDYILVEGGNYEGFVKYLKYFDRDKMILHLHHQLHSNDDINRIFSKIIGVSEYIKDDFINSSNNIDGYVLKNCVDVNRFRKNISKKEVLKLKRDLGFNEDDFIISYCGRLIKEKGVLELIKSVKNIKNDKIKLMIIGSSNFEGSKSTEYTNKLMKEIKGFEERFKFTGYINNWDLYKYFSIANISCFPSICEEAAGLSLIEAMLCNKVVIASNKGGVPEYINKENNIVIDTKNIIDNLSKAIINLSNNKDKLDIMGNKNGEFALKFNAKEYYENFITLLNKINKDKLD